jgi:hypothetical protein
LPVPAERWVGGGDGGQITSTEISEPLPLWYNYG